jgi:opacity protein-like surface antigen
MKKQTIILAVALLVAAVSTTSCTKKCHGGGWYGDRNLGYAPAKKQATDAQLKLEEDEENYCTAEP